jgi:small-conductance mechanosensitive channel
MTDFWNAITTYISSDRALLLVRAAILIGVGFILAKMISGALARLSSKKLDSHRAMLLRRGTYYLILILFLVSALHQLGFDLGVLLGAAGILTVAVGFASQTSASNLISGLFLVAERPFSVGDIIRVGTTTGEVLSIDLLSVKLRTYDNLFVRIPNETLIKTEFTNLTRFPIRRIDVMVGVAYKEDLNKVHTVLDEVADKNPLCLEEPKPLYIFQGFGDSSLNIQFSVWTKRENYIEFKSSIQHEIKEAFDRHGIEIPFPHRTLYTGSITEPFPVRVVTESTPDDNP